jgi:aspartate ammonia-lyase
LRTGKGVYDIVLENKLIEKERLEEILKPEKMIQPRKIE